MTHGSQADDLALWLQASVDHVQAEKRRAKRLRRKHRKMADAEVVEVKTLAKRETQALARPAETGISVDDLVARVRKVREVQSRVMVEGTHYGKAPGTDKPCLFKPGAELLGLTFQLAPEFEEEDRWEGEHLEARVTCTLYHAPSQTRLGSGIGSCSTKEKKYAWRNGGRKCPSCGSETALLKSKDKPEFFCWRKKDGCGATFPQNDPAITKQVVRRVPNPDLADQYNTVRKMACKRAHVAAILFVTCASEIFTQDIEEERDPGVNPHQGPGEDWHDQGDDDLFRDLCGRFAKAEADIDACDSYDKANALRAILGTRAKQSELTRTMQQKAESGDISPSQRQELGKTWMRCNRKLEKLEKQLAPGPEEVMREPGEDSEDEL